MPVLLIRHRVANYPAWKREFDDHGPVRWSNGCRGGQVYRNATEPDETLILLSFDDLVRARLYSQSDELKDSLRGAGVTDDPDMWLLEQAEEIPS